MKPEPLVTLTFSNPEAKPKKETIVCDALSVRRIMQWYGAFNAGDRYTVAIDGKRAKIDANGGLLGDL